jgi:hypothetical protein
VLSAFDPLCIRRKGVLGPRALSIIRSLCANQHYSKVCCFQLMLLYVYACCILMNPKHSQFVYRRSCVLLIELLGQLSWYT